MYKLTPFSRSEVMTSYQLFMSVCFPRNPFYSEPQLAKDIVTEDIFILLAQV